MNQYAYVAGAMRGGSNLGVSFEEVASWMETRLDVAVRPPRNPLSTPVGAQRLSVDSNALKHMIGELHSTQYSRAF